MSFGHLAFFWQYGGFSTTLFPTLHITSCTEIHFEQTFSYEHTNFLVHLRTFSEIFTDLLVIQGRVCCQSCILRVRIKISKITFFEENMLFKSVPDIERVLFELSVKIFSAGLSKLHSPFPEDHFEEKLFFRKKTGF